jgi:hypothetical protein
MDPAMRVKVLALLAAAALVLVAPVTANASVSLPVTWDALVRASTAAAVVTPVGARAVWEDGRICTYTHVHVERAVAGNLATGDEAWVRTLGGVVGKIGQIVDGEAVFSPGRRSLVFLLPASAGALAVAARGQGQFPIVDGADAAHSPTVMESHTVGMLLPASQVGVPGQGPSGATRVTLASEVLHGRLLDDAAREVATAWTTAHAP